MAEDVTVVEDILGEETMEETGADIEGMNVGADTVNVKGLGWFTASVPDGMSSVSLSSLSSLSMSLRS